MNTQLLERTVWNKRQIHSVIALVVFSVSSAFFGLCTMITNPINGQSHPSWELPAPQSVPAYTVICEWFSFDNSSVNFNDRPKWIRKTLTSYWEFLRSTSVTMFPQLSHKMTRQDLRPWCLKTNDWLTQTLLHWEKHEKKNLQQRKEKTETTTNTKRNENSPISEYIFLRSCITQSK